MAQRRSLKPVDDTPKRPAVVAAARRIDLDRKEVDGYRRKARAEIWQSEGWLYFDLLGEVKQPTYYIANACSLARIYIATQPDPEQDPSAPPQGTPGLFEAQDALERLRSGAKGGMGGLTRNFVVNAKVAGEAFLVGIEAQSEIPPGGKDPTTGKAFPEGRDVTPETWSIYSVEQVKSEGDGRGMRYTYKEEPEDNQGKPFPPGTFVYRMWQEHPGFAERADCVMRALLSTCEELMILSRMVKAVGRSRLATAGILGIASELDITAAPQPGTEGDGSGLDEKPFVEKFLEAAEANILNEGVASAAVPIVVRGPHQFLKDGIIHIPLERKLDPLALEQRKELIQRMGQGSDVPMEILVGLRQINHWTSYQVDQSLWDRYGHPTMLLWCESLTVGYLQDMMQEAGVSPDVASRFMVWFDPGGAVVQPDRTETVMQALDRFLISWDAARTILQFSAVDAPSDDEIRQRVDIAVAMKGSAGGAADGESNPAGGGAPNDGQAPTSPTAQSTDLLIALKYYIDTHDGALPPALAAAAKARRRPVGMRLMDIDRTLRLRLLEAANFTMLRALERAGARVRNRAKANARLGHHVRDLAAWQVPEAVGSATVASLGYTDDELLADGFDDLEPKFLDRIAKAQGSALDIMANELGLDETEIASIRATQERQRDEAWGWLSAALVSLGLGLLYSPEPEAPPQGEFDATVARVPAGLIREAMARAGGAQGAETSAGEPAGGVALGQLVLDTFARHGQVTRGWQWVYGDPSMRTRPFEPHENLDGEQFATWDDDVLLNPNDWPPVTHLRPTDHRGCLCDVAALGLGADEDQEALVAGAPDQPRGPDGKWLPTGGEGGGDSGPKDSAPRVATKGEAQSFLFDNINGPFMDKGVPDAARNAKAEVATTIADRMGPSQTEGLMWVAARGTLDDRDTTHALDGQGRWARTLDDNGRPDGNWTFEGAPANPPPTGIRNGIEVARGDDPDFQQSIREEGVSTLIGAWAGTSNDTNATSLALQETAANEFGLSGAVGPPIPPSADLQRQIGDKLEQHGDTYAAFMHAQYDETQAQLKAAGIENVKVYRGVQGATSGMAPAWFKTEEGGTVQDIPLRPMSSFSLDRETAGSFGYGGYGLEGRVISTTVSADRVLSTARSGAGCLYEQEFVVLSGSGHYTIEKASHA